MRKIRTHLTYANVVATLALIAALGMGSAYAAEKLAPKSVGAKQLRPGAVTADKIRKNAVTATKIASLAVKQGKIAGGAVTTAKIADGSVTGEKVDERTLSQVPSAKDAEQASFATSANPAAFAKIDAEGTLFPAASKGIGVADVKQGLEPGIYCINVPAFVPTGAQVTPEFALNSQVAGFVKFGGTASCPYPQVEVQMYSAGSRQKHPFYFMAYR